MSLDEATRTSSGAPPPQHELRRRRLGLIDVIAQSVAVIAPALSGGVVTYLAATKAGGATPSAFLLATLGALCIGGVVSEFARQLPSAGSLYTYTTLGLSRLAGFVIGCLYSLAALVIAGAVLAGFGYFSSVLVQSLTAHQGHPRTVAWYWFFLAGLAVIAAMSLFDVRVSTRAQLVLSAGSVAIMVLAAVIVIGRGSPHTSANPDVHLDLGAFWPHAAGVGWSGIWFGLAFGILSFAGFESGAVLAEETADPKQNIPRAVIGSILAAGGFYLLITYATAIGFGVREAKTAWPGSAAGLVAVTPYPWLGDLVLFAIAVSCLLCALGVLTSVSRTLFAMGRERMLPGVLGVTHRRLHTPWVAIVLALALMAAAVFACVALLSAATEAAVAAVPPESVDHNTSGLAAFAYLAGLGTPAVMACYLLVGLAGVRAGLRAARPRFVALGVAAAATGAIALYGSLYYSFLDGALPVVRLIPVLVGLVVAAAVGFGVLLRTMRRARWEAMGLVFE